MVFYFTGTGNSLYAAKELDSEIYSIPQVLNQEKLSFEAEKIGIVCPVYGHEMPGMVKEFVKKAVFRTPYFYVMLTYGANHGGAAELAARYIQSIGKEADYITTVEMVDNFLPGFDMDEQTAMDKRVEEQLAKIKADVADGKREISKATLKDKATHKMYTDWVKNAPETIWADFVITEECIGCGICTRVCPAGCIYLENQKAVHTGINCQACFACVQACPKMAIQFGDIPMKEPNPKARYRNGHVTLNELVEANDQTGRMEKKH